MKKCINMVKFLLVILTTNFMTAMVVTIFNAPIMERLNYVFFMSPVEQLQTDRVKLAKMVAETDQSLRGIENAQNTVSQMSWGDGQ